MAILRPNVAPKSLNVFRWNLEYVIVLTIHANLRGAVTTYVIWAELNKPRPVFQCTREYYQVKNLFSTVKQEICVQSGTNSEKLRGKLVHWIIKVNVAYCSRWWWWTHAVWWQQRIEDKSPLPPTDPSDAVHRAHRAVHRCRRSVL